MNRRLAVIALLLSLVPLASAARADEPAVRLPVMEAQRPLTLPKLVLEPSVVFDAVRLGSAGSYVNLDVQGAIGITDNLTVRALVAPLQLTAPAPYGFHYGQTSQDRGPSVGATYRFVKGTVEVGLGFDARLITAQYYSGVALIPSVPLRVHATDRLRIDVVPSVNITRAAESLSAVTIVGSAPVVVVPITPATTPANAVRIDVPVSALYNITEPFDVGLTTGLTIYDVSEAKGTTGIPLGLFADYAVAGRSGPVFQLEPYFTFPYLIMPAATSVTNTGEWVVGMNLSAFLYL